MTSGAAHRRLHISEVFPLPRSMHVGAKKALGYLCLGQPEMGILRSSADVSRRSGSQLNDKSAGECFLWVVISGPGRN